MQLGLCVSPGFIPSRDELAELRPKFLRSILYSIDDLDRLMATGYPLLITANNEMQEVAWWSGWDDAIRLIAERGAGQVFAIECANELDLFWQNNHADVPPSFAADLVKRAAAILRPAGIKTIATSVAGRDWQAYLEELAGLCRDEADYFNLHAYGQRPDSFAAPGWGFGDLRVALGHAYELAGKPVIMSEYGVKIGDAGGEDKAADFLLAASKTVDGLGTGVCPYVSWFAWRDQVGAPSERGQAAFGLVAEDGRRRSAWHTFAALSEAPPVVVVNPPVEAPVEEQPVPMEEVVATTLDQWRGRVGSGLLDMMAADKTEPAMASEWRPFGRPAGAPAEVEQTFSVDGTQYVWLLNENRGFRFAPEG